MPSSRQAHLAQDMLGRLRSWNGPFTIVSLEDLVANCARQGDQVTALTLYQVGLAHSREGGFDADSRLGCYLVGKLLEEDATASLDEHEEILNQTVDLIQVLQPRLGSPTPSNTSKSNSMDALVRILIERIMTRAHIQLWERLSLPYTLALLEEALIKIYLRSLAWSSVRRLLLLAQNHHWTVSQRAWQEIFEVALQPNPSERLHTSLNVRRVTDRNFEALQKQLKEMRVEGIMMSANALNALETVMSNTMVPADFLSFLRSLQ